MTTPRSQTATPRVAVIGGGLAGLAAAVAAVEQGLAVELFEARRRLGGRAASFRDPQTGQWIDNCQHVSMGCCTNLADFCRRTGLADAFRHDRRLTFIGPDGHPCPVAASRWLPAPLHLLPGLMRLGYLSLAQRGRIFRTMRRLVRRGSADDEADPTVLSWLRAQGESEEAIRRFWSVVLVSALGETLDRASLAAAGKIFADGFLASRRAYELAIPQVPLAEIYDRSLAAWLAARGVPVHRETRIKALEGDARQVRAVVLPDGSPRPFDFVVVAVPWHQLGRVIPEAMRRALPAFEAVERIEAAPITAVHLWYDRPAVPLRHAVLIDRLSQWVFCPNGSGYCQVVISASHALRGGDRKKLVAQVGDELAAIWPEARRARLLYSRVVTEPAAVFSVRPGLERLRPPQQTPIKNLMLAGDWTATGWPATMEGAVRSGYLAVETILRALGRPQRLLVADLPQNNLTRWLLRTPACGGEAVWKAPLSRSADEGSPWESFPDNLD